MRREVVLVRNKLWNIEIPFLKFQNAMFIISGILVVLSLVGLGIRGLNFGIEFEGGTSIDFVNAGSVTIDQMRSALADAGEDNAVVQTTEVQGKQGFLIRTNTTDPNVAAEHAKTTADALGLPADSYQVTTIGPDWGTSVTRSSLLAFAAAIGFIIIYISIRFEYKMSFTAIASLIHDLVIVAGIYAWTQAEITPNVIAALLTIMGYSLYDTVVVFHRINENAETLKDDRYKTFSQISNHSINQVFMRTVNTTLTSLIPVLCMLIFGGETLKDFAFAMTVGLVLGSYSSIGISTPLFVLWKTQEEKWLRLHRRYGKGPNGRIRASE